MAAGKDDLTPQMKEFLEGELAVHDWVPTFGRGTQHDAASDHAPNRRVMERITVIGDRPF